jgi:hypothetical protein
MSSYAVRIKGTGPYIQHRYPMPDEIDKFKEWCKTQGIEPDRTDDVESSCYRNGSGAYIPAFHFKKAIVNAGKGEKVAGKGNMTWNNKVKVALIISPGEIPFSPAKPSYDFVHEAYVKVGQARILRRRPAYATGWLADFIIDVDSTEVPEAEVKRFIKKSGRIGIGDNRPEKSGAYGTFELVAFERLQEAAI